MDNTSIDTLSTSRTATQLPVLGPTFISADDAAYWAHRKIGTRRDRMYGGVIVQRRDGKFQPTVPVAGRSTHFDFMALLATNDPQTLWVPLGYSGVAYYLSHAARHAEVQRFHPDWTTEQIKLSLGFFSRDHLFSHMQDPGAYGQRHYLSGPDGSLIKYESTQPGEEKKLFEQGVKPFGPFAEVEQFIQKLAATGTLSVLVPNEQWGGVRGNVSASWRLGTAAQQNPSPQQPFYSAVSNRVAEAIEAAAIDVSASSDSLYLGFVVSSTGSSQYMATYPVFSTQPAAELVKTFPMQADRKLENLQDFVLAGVYFIARGAAIAGVTEPWLYERFISPDELATGIRFSLSDVYRQEYPDYLKVFALTRDGAVLQYQPTGHLLEAPLKDSVALNSQLKSASLEPADFVRQVAAAGELLVLQDSPLWDVSGKVGAGWQPYARARRLSPAFILADDAARFAHEHIGSQREQDCVGLILKDQNDHFVATQPVGARQPRFALDWLCPLDASGAPIVLVEGHTLYGLYASRGAADATPGKFDEPREQSMYLQMFTPEDIRLVIDNGPHVAHFYLSGAPDCLLAYSSDLSKVAAREALHSRVAVQDARSSIMERELKAVTLQPSVAMGELATTGRLRVIAGNDAWGPRGAVIGAPSSPASVPPPMLGAIFSSAEDAVRNAHHRASLDYRGAAAGWGFVLKHKERDEYVATETVSVGRLGALNQSSDFGAAELIDNLRTHCLFYAGSWLPVGLSTGDAWFARHFTALGELAAAIYDEEGTQRLTHFQDLNIFIATLDGALLQYQYSATSTLFKSEGLQQLKSLMANAMPPYASVIQAIANAGALKVLRTSELWDEHGTVATAWKPFAQIQRRALSPVFLTPDDAARHALAQLGSRRERIYGGLVLRRLDGLFVATLPLAVDVENFPPSWIRLDALAEQGLFLGGSTVVARYHSRIKVEPVFGLSNRERDVYLNMFSTDFLAGVVGESGLSAGLSPGKEYLMGLDGSLICYTRSGSAREKQLAQSLASASQLQRRQSAVELQMRSGALSPSHYVNLVAAAGSLQVLEGSPLWGEARQLSSWSAYPGVISTELRRFATADPALSPIFTQMDDAVRHVHRSVGVRNGLMFGYVLKSVRGERYVATLPIDGRQGHLTVERVFPEGLLPQNYRVEGVYLCPSTQSLRLPNELHQSFISPRDLTFGLDAVGIRTSEGTDYLSVYISCADGALLRYKPTTSAPEWTQFQATVAYEKLLQSGQESLIEYLRKVTHYGELRVVTRSVFWAPVRVDGQGVRTGIGLVSWVSDNRFALGPVFAHADDAARSAQKMIGQYVGMEFLGGVLTHEASGSFTAVEPLGDRDAATALFYSGPGGPIAPVAIPGAQPLPLPVFPPYYKWIAVHQFYKRFNLFVKDPSETDRLLLDNLALADLWFSRDVLNKSGVPGGSCYFTGRDGSLFKFTPSFSEQETAFLRAEVKDGVAAYLTRLAGFGRLEVLGTGGYWQRRGQLSALWKPAPLPAPVPGRDEL